MGWSNLPLDLVESIMKRLHYIDHLRVRAVCRNWYFMFKVSPSKQLPWLLILHKHSWDSFKLYDPTSNRSFLIELKPSFLQTENSLVSIHTCKYSWLLLSQTLNYSIFFYLYSPFNTNLDKVIKLPKLTSSGLVDVASFSSSPNSSNFLVFSLKSLYSSVDISTYRLGDDKWHTRKFLLPSPLSGPVVYNFIYHVEYLDRIFYCLSRNGMLGIYNVAEENYCLHEVKKLRYSTNSYMVKTEKGEILLIDIVNRRCINKIYQLDFTKMAWVESDGLDLQECYDPWIMGFKIDSREIDKNYCKKIWIEPPY